MRALNLPTLTQDTPVLELVNLAGGCTTGRWVCSRLDQVRRRYSL